MTSFARRSFRLATIVTLSAGISAFAATIQRQTDGVALSTGSGVVRVQVWSERIVRVTAAPGAKLPATRSFSVIAKPAKTKWNLRETRDAVVVETPAMRVRADKASGRVEFLDLKNRPILRETDRARSRQSFALPAEERIYGLGQHQSGAWNYRGRRVRLQQQNMEVAVPVLVSSRGYGLLWDNPAVTDVDAGKTNPEVLTWESEAGEGVDYYFLYGPTADDVIRSYRRLTGAAPLMPKWLWGFWQCKERYQTQAEMTNVVAEYRRRGVPLDGIIQDWQYWPKDGWGSHEFDPARYSDPAKMVSDLHAMNAHVLISVWPKFDLGLTNLVELERVGAVYDHVFPSVYPKGQQKWYDPFSAAGRRIYWKQISERLFKLGFDGWWLDASEPELSGRWGEFREFQTAAGPGSNVFNAYPLLHTTGVYQGQRAESNQRVVILTRSAWAGQQRNAAITWSGDIKGSWDVFAKQIPAGLNFSLSGIPYWNTDIGGFFGGNPADKNYAELFTRWFQFGAFNPMFRVHGTGAAKELWRWDQPTQEALVKFIKLRYRLLPYLYSVSWQVTRDGGTMMRPLMMDFADALDVGDQFMFGPAILVAPVTQYGARSRSVCLPAGDWYDFWTGAKLVGGQTIEAPAPYDSMPLYVRAGSIVPMGPDIQHTGERPDPITLHVYEGADTAFTLYEDDGVSYDYERGARAEIPIHWNQAKRTLTIGKRAGSFPGMLKERTLEVVFVSGQSTQRIVYRGDPVMARP